jgi:hypothetical protein
MANTFKRQISRNIGNVAVGVGSYTVGASTTTVVVGLTICNTTGSSVAATVALNDGANDYLVVNEAPIPGGGTLVVVGGEQKIVLETGDSLTVTSDTASSLDAVMSIMEIT